MVLTKRGNDAALQDRRDSAAQRRADLQPRPEIEAATGRPDKVVLHVSNPGNTTPLWYVLIVVASSVYYIRASASAGCAV